MDELNEVAMDIDCDILLELSLSNLKNNTRRDFGPDRETKSNKVNVVNYEMIPSVGQKSLLIKARVRGEEGNYQPQIRFTNVQFKEFDYSGVTTTIKAMDGSDYHINQISAAQAQAKVKCNCLDFYWRFAKWNKIKDSLEGDPPPPYVKKTDRAPVNPNKTPGICKHLTKLVAFLRAEKILR